MLQHRDNRARPACSVGVFSALKSRLNNNDCDIRARTLHGRPGERSACTVGAGVLPQRSSWEELTKYC